MLKPQPHRALALAIAALLPTAIATPAFAMTPVSELRDVSSDHWAYNAIQTLVEKYQVMEGFPDRTFRGSKTLTRYELAAALAKVMARVEERIAIATGQPVNVDPGVNPEDLRTIARLQREFREELDALKSRVDTMDSRLMTLEKRVKITGSVSADYRDFTGANPLASEPSADFRLSNRFNGDAQLMDDLAVSTTLQVDTYAPQSTGNAFLRRNLATPAGITAGPITDIYMPKGIIHYTPGWIDYTAGLGSWRDSLEIGSRLTDPFKQGLWREGTGGFGFVGTPGILASGSVATWPTGNTLAGAPEWLPGTNILVDMVNPNNAYTYGPNGDFITAGHISLGPVKLGLGFDRGSVSGKTVLSGDPLEARTLPHNRTWDDGTEAMLTLGLDLNNFHAGVVAQSPSRTAFRGASLHDKILGANVDIGTEALALSGELVSQSDFQFGNFQASKASLRLGSANLLDTGFGLGLGMVTGNPMDAPAIGASAPLGGSLFSNQAAYTSLGLMLKTPAIFVIPSFTLAAQNTLGGPSVAFSGNAIGSGLTLGTSFQLFGLPTMTAEYSLGKFTAGQDNTLWGSTLWSVEQLGVQTNFKF